MVDLQVVCKNVTAEELRKVLKEFGELEIEGKKQHVLISLTREQPTDKILLKCREHAYAYLRVVAWEEGGGLVRTGQATCVAGVTGEPLKPISVRVHGERGNKKHALFGSRNGLVMAEASRLGEVYCVVVTEYRLEGFLFQDPEVVLEAKGTGSPEQVLDEIPPEKEMYFPVILAALKKTNCQYCIHAHYRRVESHG